MAKLPVSVRSLLVRTDFTNDETWQQVSHEAQADNSDGFRAYVQPVSDPAFDGATWQLVKASVPAESRGTSVLFVADTGTLAEPDHPILVVDLRGGSDRAPFRCIAAELWGIENNLNIANMDWEEFADAVDADGIFRGFHSMPAVRLETRSGKTVSSAGAAG
jgi:hypothetical protein